MKAIEKAWEINLKLPIEEQYESKEAIIDDSCPYSIDFKLKLKGINESEYLCDVFCEKCEKCWNSKIEEDESKDDNESTFNELYISPIKGIELNSNAEIYFKDLIKQGKTIIHIADRVSRESVTYNNIPSLIEWLQNVYNFSTELKNKVKYVGFETAKNHMKDGNNAYYNSAKYNIEDVFTIDAIESDKWILD